VFVIGCAITAEETYRQHALPGIERIREPDTLVVEQRGPGSLQRKYNEALDGAASHDDLEGVVLLHQDTEILEPGPLAKARHRFADPRIAIIGAFGARGVRNVNWWDGSVLVGKVGTPGFPGCEVMYTTSSFGAHEVDMVDGFFLILSPWAARDLRFDPAFEPLHGYDIDICFQARARGRIVLVEDLEVAHYHPPPVLPDRESWVRAHLIWHRKWSPDRVRSVLDR
jgi:hypothetical protein